MGVGAAPSEFDFSIRPGGSVTETLHVINTGDSEAHYRVYVDEEYESWVSISPTEFSLAPQANRKVQIIVSPPLFSFSSYDTYIYVVAINPSSQLGVGAGIKIPVHIHISSLSLWVGIGIATALLVALLLFLIRRRRITGNEPR